ncbi:MAG: TonB-dependent receptor [Terracidiphilus sp.]|jgi:hypothetical protein
MFSRLEIKGLGSLLSLTLLFLLIPFRAQAQSTTADVVGTVTDPSGAVVPGAKVTITNLETQVKEVTKSNQTGDYVFNLVDPGRYSVSIEANGFKMLVIPVITLAAGDRTREDGQMQTGAVVEKVEVTAAAPLLQTDSSSVSSVVPEQSVQALPLNGRNFIGLVTILPGVNAGPPGAISSGNRPDDRRQTSTVSANGQGDLYNNEMIDGMDNNEREQGFLGVRPSVEAIAEVTVDTSLYSADIGRNAGAVVNIITKSGTDQYHGSAYEFFRNDIFDARDFFAKVNVTAKPEYRLNQFGGGIGGPIVKGKTFFFADVEDFRSIQGLASTLSTVPTLYEEQNPGDFSDIGGPVVPTASLNPVGLAYFKMYPAPNIPGAGAVNNFFSAPPKPQFALSLDGRVDHHFRNGDPLSGRYTYNKVQTTIPTPFPAVKVDGETVLPGGPGGGYGYYGPSTTNASNTQLDYAHVFSPTLLLELKAGYTRINIDTQNPNGQQDISSTIGLINVNTPIAPETGGLMPVNLNGYTGLGDSNYIPILDVNNTFQYMGALTYTRGAHNIKVGAGVIRRQLNYFQSSSPLGNVNFQKKTGNSEEDLLTGDPQGYGRGNLLIKPGYRDWEPDFYLQDDWRVNRSLTLNLGVRYEIFSAFTEAHNRYANFDYPTLTLITGSTSPTIGINTSYKNISPRIGFSQSIGKDTVVRGGYGITYYPAVYQTLIQNPNPPYEYLSSCNPCAPFWPALPVPIPSSTTNLSGNLSYLPSNLNTSMIQQFNVMAQQKIGENVFSLGYVGSVGRDLRFDTTVNIPPPNGPYPNDATQGPPPAQPLLTSTKLPNVGTIGASLPVGIENYNSLQAVFARRFTHGLAFNANYTWAHGLGDTADSSSAASFTGLIATDPRYDYGNQPIDIRQRFAVYFTYDLPFAAGATGAEAWLLKGWTANMIDYWQTGLPFTVSDGFSNPNGLPTINLPTDYADRPNWSGQTFKVPHPSINQWFSVAAFTPQPAGTAGNEPDDALHGPHTRRADFSLSKTFKLTERDTLQFRAECYNISNTPNFSLPSAGIEGWNPGPEHNASNPISEVGLLPGDIATTCCGVGTIGSTASGVNPRQYQFALKFLF